MAVQRCNHVLDNASFHSTKNMNFTYIYKFFNQLSRHIIQVSSFFYFVLIFICTKMFGTGIDNLHTILRVIVNFKKYGKFVNYGECTILRNICQ